MKVLREFEIRGLKIIDIGYITVIYFLIGIVFAKLFDKLYGTFDPVAEKKKSMTQQTLELIGMMWVTGVVTYIIRNVVQLIPSPVDNLFGFQHLRVKELTSAGTFTFVFLFFQAYFKSKLQYYYNNLHIF
jgi:hypothetical protein